MRCPECTALAYVDKLSGRERCVRCGWLGTLSLCDDRAPPPYDAPGEVSTQGMFRFADPETSKQAARVVVGGVGKIQQLVLRVYAERGPMSARRAERLPEFAAYGFSTIRKRISELHQSGHLLECGIDESGRAPATVYRAPPRGPEDRL